MATIKPKRGTGAPTGLVQHELAVNTAGRIIYLGNTGGTGDIIASHTTVRGLSGPVGISAGKNISVTNSGNTVVIGMATISLSDLTDVNSTVSTSSSKNQGLVFDGSRYTNTPIVLSLNGTGGDVTAVTSLAAAAGISLSGSSGDITVENIGVVQTNAGLGISVSGATGTVTITNTGVTQAVAGSGISVSSATGRVTITNSGVRAAAAGAGISISGTNSITITNQGVRSLNGSTGDLQGVSGLTTDTLGIYLSGSTGSVTVRNTGVFSVVAGNSGIGVSTIAASDNPQYVTITNTGVTQAVAGSGISVSGATGAVTITNAGVTGITGTANEITVSGTTGFVTIGLPDSITVLDLNTDQVDFNTNPGSTAMAQGRMLWDTVESTVGLGMNSNVTCKIGENLYKFAHNNTGSPINKGEVVYVSGSQGETLLRIAKAQANDESTSATTVGVAAETIAHGATGFVTVFGLLTGIATNTIGAAAGDPLYLSETTAGALRAGIPTQPNHGVRVGFLVKSAGAGSGAIFVNVQNYQELEELSDVFVSGVTSNHMLLWDSTDGRWENRSPTDVRSALGLSSVVSTVNGLSGAIGFSAGTGVSVTTSGNTLTIETQDIFVRNDGDSMSGALSISTGSTTSTTSLSVTGTLTGTANTAVVFTNFNQTISPATSSLSDFRSLNMTNRGTVSSGVTLNSVNGARIEGLRFGASQNSNVTTIRGIYALGGLVDTVSFTGGVQATTVYGIQAAAGSRPAGSATGSFTNAYGGNFRALETAGFEVQQGAGVLVSNSSEGSTLTTNIGVDVASQTRGTSTNYGIRVAAPTGAATNAAIQLSDTTGFSNGGLLFGTDTNLYRSNANTLKTDDNFVATGTITGSNLSGTNTGDQTFFAGSGISLATGAAGITITNTGVTGIQISGGTAATGGIILAQGSNVTITRSGNTFTFAAALSGASAGVTTLNGLSGAIELVAGKAVTITDIGDNQLAIAFEPDGASFGVSTIGGLSGAVGLIGGTGVSITTSGNTFTVANTGVVSFGNSTTSGETYGIRVSGTTGSGLFLTNTGVTTTIGGTGISVSGATGTVTFTNTGVVSFGNSTTSGGTYGIRVSGTTGSGVFLTNTGVTTAVAGSGISVSGATGTVTITNQGVRSFSASTNTTDTVQNLSVTPSSGTGDVSLSFNVIAVKTITGSGSGIEVTQASLAEGQGGYAITISNTGVHAINNPKTASGGTYGVRVTGNTGSLEIINTGVTFAQAGSGISVSGATGTVTITNTGLTGIAKSGGAYATGNVTLVEGSNITITQSGSTFTIASSGGGGGDVSSVNGATGAITLVGGTDISITPSGSTFTIAYTGVGGPGGGVSTVNGLSGAVGLAVGLGLTLTSSGNTLNIAGLTASTSQIGVASFNSTNFSVSGGVVSITAINGGTF